MIRVNKCLAKIFHLLLIMEPIEVNGENAEATISMSEANSSEFEQFRVPNSSAKLSFCNF